MGRLGSSPDSLTAPLNARIFKLEDEIEGLKTHRAPLLKRIEALEAAIIKTHRLVQNGADSSAIAEWLIRALVTNQEPTP